MDLWIRNQSDYQEQKLIKAEQVKIDLVLDNWMVDVNNTRVAQYTSREQAIKVLNEIQNLLIDRYIVGDKPILKNCIIYQMPLDKKGEN